MRRANSGRSESRSRRGGKGGQPSKTRKTTRRKRAATAAGTGKGGKGRRATKNGTPKSVNTLRRTFPSLAQGDGCAAMILAVERVGKEWDQCAGICEIRTDRKRSRGGGGALRAKRTAANVARAFAAVGHEQRIRILTKLLEGPAIYRALQRRTRLKAGPLYHHINQLRLAGLIRPKQRDLYELTRGGRNLILVLLAAASLIRDSKSRPLGLSERRGGDE